MNTLLFNCNHPAYVPVSDTENVSYPYPILSEGEIAHLRAHMKAGDERWFQMHPAEEQRNRLAIPCEADVPISVGDRVTVSLRANGRITRRFFRAERVAVARNRVADLALGTKGGR